jgi:hypothetical protein
VMLLNQVVLGKTVKLYQEDQTLTQVSIGAAFVSMTAR